MGIICLIFTINQLAFAASTEAIGNSAFSTLAENYTVTENNDDCNTGGVFKGLQLGDIAFNGYLCDGAHEYSFVLLVNIPSGTAINFTDRGWKSTGGFRDGEEDIVTWTATSALPAGTEVLIHNLTASVGTVTATTGSPLQFTDQGDQVFAYYGDTPTAGDESSFLAAIHMNGEWDATASSARTSAKPSVFTDGVTSIAIAPEKDNAYYICDGLTEGTAAVLRTALNTKENWNATNLVLTEIPVCGFTVTDANNGGGGGLPCGYEETTINCNEGTTGVEYNRDNQSYGIKVDGCSHNGYGPDGGAFVYTELCGNGKFVARITDFHGSGFAGVMARESLDPRARKLGALKYGSRYYVAKEYRATTGGNLHRSRKYRPHVSWFKLVRYGNTIRAYTSRGYRWRFLYERRYSNLSQCLYVGLSVYAYNEDSQVRARFDHVNITSFGGSNYVDQGLSLEDIRDMTTTIAEKENLMGEEDDFSIQREPETMAKTGALQLYPNPASQEVMIDLSEVDLQSGGSLELYNSVGQSVFQRKLSSFENEITRLDLNEYSNGLYYVHLRSSSGETSSLPLVIRRY